MRRWVLAFLLCVVGAPSARAAAQQVTYDLEYTAPVECPDAARFRRSVEARTRDAAYRSGRADRHLRVTITHNEAGFRGELGIEAGEAPRVVSGASCNSVAEALALIVSVTIRAEIVLPPARTVAPRATDPTDTPRARPIVGERSSLRSVLVTGAGGALTSGPAPAPMYGPEIILGVELGVPTRPALRVVASRSSTGIDESESGAARFVLSAVRLEGCPRAMSSKDVLLAGCLALEGGVLEAEGVAASGLTRVQAVTRSWVEIDLVTRASWILLEGLRLELSGAVGLPLTRRTFVLEDSRQKVHQAPVLVGRVGIGLLTELP